jgi:hypothetical protein
VQGGDNIIGVDFSALAVGGSFFGGLSLTAPPCVKRRACVRAGLLRKTQGVLPVLYPVMLMNSSRIADFSFRHEARILLGCFFDEATRRLFKTFVF